MATHYIMFQSSSDKVDSNDCTTRWDDKITCSIILSGIYNGKVTNLQIMSSEDDTLIQNWISENAGKVQDITSDEMLSIGQSILPDGTIIEDTTEETSKKYTTTFTVPNGVSLSEIVA